MYSFFELSDLFLKRIYLREQAAESNRGSRNIWNRRRATPFINKASFIQNETCLFHCQIWKTNPIFKIISEKAENSVWNIYFFVWQKGKPFFLHYNLHTTGSLRYQIGLIWTTLRLNSKDLFFKLLIWNNRKFPYEKLNLSLGKLYQKLFLHYTLNALVILHTKFGSLWTALWPNQKDLILKNYLKLIIRINQNFRTKN